MLTAKLGESVINCIDGKYDRYRLKQWSVKGILKCPICGGEYEYCHGEVISPYFRHVGKECNTYYSEPETYEHINGKLILYNWIKKQSDVKNCNLEYWIPETKQRPDIYFEYRGKRFVIEFQCTPIASEFLIRRELYRLAGINDIWILGTSKYSLSLDTNGNAIYPKPFKTIEAETLKNGYLIYLDVRNKLFIGNSNLLPINKDLKKFIVNITSSSSIKRFDLFDAYYSHNDFLFVEEVDNFIYSNDGICVNEEISSLLNFVENQYKVEADRLINTRKTIRSKSKDAKENSDHVGFIGDNIETEAILLQKRKFKSIFKTLTTVYTFADESGNIYVWYTSSSPSIREGQMIRLTGKIKSHLIYDGTKQTVITRCKINT